MIVEFSPNRLAIPTQTDREDGVWNDFVSKMRRILDSRTVCPTAILRNRGIEEENNALV